MTCATFGRKNIYVKIIDFIYFFNESLSQHLLIFFLQIIEYICAVKPLTTAPREPLLKTYTYIN